LTLNEPLIEGGTSDNSVIWSKTLITEPTDGRQTTDFGQLSSSQGGRTEDHKEVGSVS